MEKYLIVRNKRKSPEPANTTTSTARKKLKPTVPTAANKNGLVVPNDEKTNKGESRERTDNNGTGFCEKWLQMTEFKDWLARSVKNDKLKAHCRICDVELTAHKAVLKKHLISKPHEDKRKAVANIKDIKEQILSSLDKKIATAEIALTGFIATEDLPMLLMNKLVPLCTKIFPDSKIAAGLKCARTKTTEVINEVLGPCFNNDLSEFLKSQPFSLIFDETTDCSSKKQCASTVIFYDEQADCIRRTFFDIFEGDIHGDCVTLCKQILASLEKQNIPKTQMVALSTDTTNVMAGEHNSLCTQLKKEIPGLVTIKCTCHLIHLCAEKSCLKLPRSLEDLLRDVASHFSQSHQRQLVFEKIQESFKVDKHRILKRAETRWLSREACVNRIIEQFEPLKKYFNDIASTEHSITTSQISSTLNNPYTLLYLHFMSYVLSLLNDINTLFQSKTPLLHKLKPEIERLLKNVCLNFIKKPYVQQAAEDIFSLNHYNKDSYVPKHQLYLGVNIYDVLEEFKKMIEPEKKTEQPQLDKFYSTCQDFYIELVTQIKQRFVFTDPIYRYIEILNPATAIGFTIPSLLPIVKYFPALSKSDIDRSKLEVEYRDFSLLNFEKLEIDKDTVELEVFWKKIFNLKNAAGKKLYVNLAKVIKLLLILPFSNVDVERIFSGLKDIKTDKCNKLDTKTVCSLLCCKSSITDCVTFQPSQKILNTFFKRKERHPPKPKDGKKSKENETKKNDN